MLTLDDAYGKQFEEFHVGFEGSFGGKHVTPRSIAARHLGNLVCVEGIVTKCRHSTDTRGGGIYIPTPFIRFSCEAKGYEECALLSGHQEDNREEIF